MNAHNMNCKLFKCSIKLLMLVKCSVQWYWVILGKVID